jgi:2,4-diketo-3-deoxy-L-fuconate hydrolase
VRVANLSGRLVLVTDEGAIDVEKASTGRFSSDPQGVYEQWPEFVGWAKTATGEAVPFDLVELGPPVPRPAQVFGIGANYRSHAAEGGMAVPEWPMIFTKYVSSFTGPVGEIELPSDAVDWEVELVFVVGRLARNVRTEQGWDYVAGLTVGQDLSDREVQLRGGELPQMSMGKSLPGFSPMGPFLVTPDAVPNPDALAISCSLDGETLQRATTADLVFSVPALVAELSAMVPLLPGDVVFTGTPAGVGLARKPPRFLQPGEQLVSRIEGLGEMRHTFSSASHARRGSDQAALQRLLALQTATSDR